jgi:hypothetical protein
VEGNIHVFVCRIEFAVQWCAVGLERQSCRRRLCGTICVRVSAVGREYELITYRKFLVAKGTWVPHGVTSGIAIPRCVWSCNISEVVKCVCGIVYVDVFVNTAYRALDIVGTVFYSP